MPAGCDFICRNKECENCDTGFTITAPWPMGHIDDVINSSRVKELQSFQEKLQDLKESGREYVCITFPNVDNVETKCYRVNLWSVGEKCLWQYDVPIEENETLEESIKKACLPDKCPKTNSKMLSYKEAIIEKIKCPSCNEELDQGRWFTKEKINV